MKKAKLLISLVLTAVMALTMLGGCAGNAADEKSTKSPDQDINASEEPTVNPTETPAEEPTEAPSEEPIVDPCSVVSFSNPIFEAVFREKYGFGDNTIYMSDILEFEVLDLSNQRLRGILDIAMFTNLTELNLGYNSISDSNNYYDDYEYHYDGDVLIGYALLCISALYQLLLLPKLPDFRTF